MDTEESPYTIRDLRLLEKQLNSEALELSSSQKTSNQVASLYALPTELLLKIFEEQSYSDLKLRTGLVCRRFYDVLQRREGGSFSRIDRTLFQDAPRKDPNPFLTADAGINPILEPGELDWRYSPNVNEIIFRSRRSRWGFVRHVDASVRLENACSPAVRKAVVRMSISFSHQPDIIIKSAKKKGSVTVMDVMEGIAEQAHKSVVAYRWKGFTCKGPTIVDGILNLFITRLC